MPKAKNAVGFPDGEKSSAHRVTFNDKNEVASQGRRNNTTHRRVIDTIFFILLSSVELFSLWCVIIGVWSGQGRNIHSDVQAAGGADPVRGEAAAAGAGAGPAGPVHPAEHRHGAQLLPAWRGGGAATIQHTTTSSQVILHFSCWCQEQQIFFSGMYSSFGSKAVTAERLSVGVKSNFFICFELVKTTQPQPAACSELVNSSR